MLFVCFHRTVKLDVNNKLQTNTTYNVIGTITGSLEPGMQLVKWGSMQWRLMWNSVREEDGAKLGHPLCNYKLCSETLTETFIYAFQFMHLKFNALGCNITRKVFAYQASSLKYSRCASNHTSQEIKECCWCAVL